MLELFKRNTFISILLLIPYALILHLSAWFIPAGPVEFNQDWFFELIFNKLTENYQYATVFSILIIVIQAIVIAVLVNKFRILNDGQLYPSLLFIILVGLSKQTLDLNPVLLANVFFTLALYQLFNIYQKKQAGLHLFNFGFLTGLSSLIYLPYYIMIVLGVLGLMLLRGFRPKEFLQLLGGFITLYLLMFSILYLADLHNVFYVEQICSYFNPYMFSMVFNSTGWITFGLVFSALLFCLINYSSFQIKLSILSQKLFDLLFWCLGISLLSIVFLVITRPEHLIILYTPLAILLGTLLLKLKNPLISETVHLFLILLCLFLQFQNW